ncbi:MAG: hypothetical protein KGI27_15450, partial [Thaumarchaeota archaeon]|nr:hypothetical protein [Nitrososphaerota archaeon]
MKIQNNKTKTATTIIGALVIGFILMSPQIIIPNINAELQNTISTSNTSCVKKVQQQMYSNEKM